MPFRPCPSGCGFYLSTNDRHNRCVQCLGRGHTDAAFAEGGCQACEDMPLSTLCLRVAFFSKKPRLTSTASRSGPSTSGYKVATMCVEGEREESSDVLPGTSPQTAHPVCLPMECPDDFESSSQYGLDLLFSAPAEEKKGSAASVGEREPSDVTVELTAPAAESQSVADAEMAAALQWVAKENGVRSSEGVYRDPPGGESDCEALVPAKRRLLEGPPETPVQGLCIQLRCSSNPLLLRAEGGPLQEQLRPRNLPLLQLDPPNGPALVGRWQHQLILRPLRTLVRHRSAPETGSPGKRDRLTCPDPHSMRGRALDSAPTRLSATWQRATTWSIKEQFPSSLGVTHSTSDPLHDGRMLCPPFRTCGHTPPVFPHVLRQRAHSDDSSPQGNPLVSSHGTNPPGKTASGLRGFSPPATHRFPSHGVPILGTSAVTPLRLLVENFSDWLSLPNPSCWLLRTIRLSYVIQFARRPPKFRGVLATSVRGSSTAVLRAEITVLLAKDAIETVPSAEMKKGFYSPYFIVPKKGGGLRPILDLRVLNRALLKLPFKMFGQAQLDLFASPESTHCQLWYGLTEAPLGIDALGHSWPRDLLKYAFPKVSLIAQTLCKVREDNEQILLVAPFWPNRTWFSDLVLLASAPPWRIPEGPPFSGEGHNLAPAHRSLEPPPMVPECDQEDFRDLSPSVVNTLLQARAPSTRRLYDLKWRIFVNWCSSRGRCGIKSVLSFLQGGLDRHLSASTLKVHVAAISANHDLVGGRSVGKHDLVIRFLRGAQRLNPPRPHLIPSWDLAVVLQGLQQDPFEPLQDQVVTLQAISSQEDDLNLTLLCPVRALRIYFERTRPFRCSEQLFVCYGGQQKGKAVSKQRISHWLVDASCTAYQTRGLPCPLGVRAHSTRGVAASAALANGASLTDICRAA
ncbi:hypothetical protein M9458_053368, partial [Cirrhinus mrigala]